MTVPKVSILSVTYNNWHLTEDLLRSIHRITYPNWEIVIVDNGSSDKVSEDLIIQYPDVIFLRSNKNLGFAGGNNFGMEKCDGDFVLFINNDVEVESDFIEPLVAAFSEYPNVGMASPRIHYFSPPGVCQYAGCTEINPFTIRNITIGNGQKDVGQFLESRITGYVHGAAMLVSKNVIEKVGMMYEDYFLYYEEYDWCHRIKKNGYQAIYVGSSLVHHKESASTGQNSPLRTYYLTRNRLLFARRNFSFKNRIISMFFFTLVSVPKNIFSLAIKGQFNLIGAFIRGVWWNLIH